MLLPTFGIINFGIKREQLARAFLDDDITNEENEERERKKNGGNGYNNQGCQVRKN